MDTNDINQFNMESIFNKIIKQIVDCENEGRMFVLPSFTDASLVINHSEVEPTGSILTGDEWRMSKGDEYLDIVYVSKDKCRTFQNNPDRSVITIKGRVYKDEILTNVDYTNGWDEGN